MSAQAEVVLVGCGCPLRGMGWYHAVQMLGGECPSAKLSYIVEPWFLGAGKCFFVIGSKPTQSTIFHCCNKLLKQGFSFLFLEFIISFVQVPVVQVELNLLSLKRKLRRNTLLRSTQVWILCHLSQMGLSVLR